MRGCATIVSDTKRVLLGEELEKTEKRKSQRHDPVHLRKDEAPQEDDMYGMNNGRQRTKVKDKLLARWEGLDLNKGASLVAPLNHSRRGCKLIGREGATCGAKDVDLTLKKKKKLVINPLTTDVKFSKDQGNCSTDSCSGRMTLGAPITKPTEKERTTALMSGT